VLVSLSATAPTMPANYSYSRRIGSLLTNGSAQWVKFVQDGDLFQWDAPTLDVNANNPGSAAVTRTLTTPTGVKTRAVLNVVLTAGAGGDGVYLSDLEVSDQAAASAAAPGYQVGALSTSNAAQVTVRTNTSAQIRSRNVSGTATETLRINTVGWYDARGREA
jgi:FlaG/FlaF family flagellin (archaellin)